LTSIDHLLRAYRLDRTVADEIEMSLRTGIVANPNNEVSHRVARNTGRQSTRARNARESEELSDATHDLKQQIAEKLEKRRESNTLTKELKNKLRSLKGTGQTNQQKLLSASSSGRVKSAPVRSIKSLCTFPECLLTAP
jgi:polyribonucleotide nucleotidyltransferase